MDQTDNHKIKETEQLSINPVSQDVVTQASPSKVHAVDPEHPLAKIISLYLHRLRDIEVSLQAFIPLAVELTRKKIDKIRKDIDEIISFDASRGPQATIQITKKALKVKRQVDRLESSHLPEVVETSLFLGMFSAYDAFTGNLIAQIYRLKPDLFNIINRNVPVSEILKYSSFEVLKESVLRVEIESFRRKSYVEQFEDMEKAFGLNLKDFGRWSQFVECAQRRNLLTHCDGVVSEQYLQVCKREGYVFSSTIQVGDKLDLGAEYFLQSCELLMEVGLKLGQTLWRKLFPDQINEADTHLIQVTYDCLQREKWRLAQVFGEFAIKQKKISSDLNYKISIINYAISLKFGGNSESALSTLKTVDWTAAIDEFKLAEAVLLNEYDLAAEIMKKIGKSGSLIGEHAYHVWPLFNEFRASRQFLEAYEKIYEYPFFEELKREAIKAEEVASRKEPGKETDTN